MCSHFDTIVVSANPNCQYSTTCEWDLTITQNHTHIYYLLIILITCVLMNSTSHIICTLSLISAPTLQALTFVWALSDQVSPQSFAPLEAVSSSTFWTFLNTKLSAELTGTQQTRPTFHWERGESTLISHHDKEMKMMKRTPIRLPQQLPGVSHVTWTCTFTHFTVRSDMSAVSFVVFNKEHKYNWLFQYLRCFLPWGVRFFPLLWSHKTSTLTF